MGRQCSSKSAVPVAHHFSFCRRPVLAETLGVSSAFLSAVENGKKKFPDAWFEKMEDYYNLTTNQMEELKTAVIESSDVVELNMSNASFENRQLAVSFARQFDSLDEETSRKIFNILNKHQED